MQLNNDSYTDKQKHRTIIKALLEITLSNKIRGNVVVFKILRGLLENTY